MGPMTLMKRISLFMCIVAALATLHAAQFPQLLNTNTVPGGTGAPPKTAAEALAEMKLPAGFKASVFAAEPDIQNAIQLTWDTHGRLWVAENYTMDSDRFIDTFRDRIVILDNADGGTKFETRRVFFDQFKNLMGFAIGYGGVWVMAPPQHALHSRPQRRRRARWSGRGGARRVHGHRRQQAHRANGLRVRHRRLDLRPHRSRPGGHDWRARHRRCRSARACTDRSFGSIR